MKKKSIKARIAERDLRFEELRIARDELESSKEKLAKARMRVKKAMRAVSAARVGVEDARKRHVASIEALSEQPPWPRPPNNAPSPKQEAVHVFSSTCPICGKTNQISVCHDGQQYVDKTGSKYGRTLDEAWHTIKGDEFYMRCGECL